MDDILFTIIAVMATLAFAFGIVTGFWPILTMAFVMAALMYWLSKRLV